MTDTQGYHTSYIDNTIYLQSPACTFTLDTADSLRGTSWENHLTGQNIPLGLGPEFEIDLDSADRRVYIEGWRAKAADLSGPTPDEETGFREGYYNQYFDDSSWEMAFSPAMYTYKKPQEYYWYRTHMFIPTDAEGKPLTLVLGGFGIWDYRYMRVFINGREVGERRTLGRWFEPGEFNLGPETAFNSLLRFGQDNIIALQMASPISRTPRLEEFDPRGTHDMPIPEVRPAQFEQYLVVGASVFTPKFEVKDVQISESPESVLAVELTASDVPVKARVTYGWNHEGSVLKKQVVVENTGTKPCRLLHVRLGDYSTNANLSDGEQGYPVYLDEEMFASLKHPSGWAIGQNGRLLLRQYPGCMLNPGEAFESMVAVFGNAAGQEARKFFLDYLQTQMRRTVRGHDKVYAVFETFGSRPDGDFLATEELVLDKIARVEEGSRATGYHFDLSSIEFWADVKGDLMIPSPERFPGGFDNIKSALARMNTSLALWIDSTSGGWNIGENPVIAHCRANNPGYPESTIGMHLCRATDPFKTMFTTAFRKHIRENGVRLLKFDNLYSMCHNTTHEHLPGVYSTEAIQNSVINTLKELDAECPDVFLVLYWGYSSPWWLLHGDVLFECGIAMEAATPSPRPSLYARDGVGVSLDEATAWVEDIPKLGKDSLGVWLSHWSWNSCIGKERWQEGLALDMCRGSMLVQIWSDTPWLTPEERKEFAHFLQLAREREDCLKNSQPILSSPWDGKPYGYSCTNGGRGVIVINNCTWEDVTILLQLTEVWGLCSDQKYRLYRHHPRSAELVNEDGSAFSQQTQIRMRPWEVVLLEVVPEAEKFTDVKTSSREPALTPFVEPSRRIECRVESLEQAEASRIAGDLEKEQKWRGCKVTVSVPPTAGGTLVVAVEAEKNGRALLLSCFASQVRGEAFLNEKKVESVPVLADYTHVAAWQAWRIAADASSIEQQFVLNMATCFGEEVDLQFACYYVPI